jgi:hypothetical protein
MARQDPVDDEGRLPTATNCPAPQARAAIAPSTWAAGVQFAPSTLVNRFPPTAARSWVPLQAKRAVAGEPVASETRRVQASPSGLVKTLPSEPTATTCVPVHTAAETVPSGGWFAAVQVSPSELVSAAP